MRQSGVLAAPAMIAMQDSPSLLPADHENARLFADGVLPDSSVKAVFRAEVGGRKRETQEFVVPGI